MTESARKRLNNFAIVMDLYYCACNLADKYESFGNSKRAEEIMEITRNFSRLKISNGILNTDLKCD